MLKRYLMISFLALATLTLAAKVRQPHMIGDHMILQQLTEARLWGWAQPGRTVRVTTRFFGRDLTQTVKADAKGRWLIGVKTPQAGYRPYSVTRSEERRVGKECRSRWSPYH